MALVESGGNVIMNRLLGRCLILGLFLALTSCKSWFAKNEELNMPYKNLTEKQLYAEAKHALAKDQYASAI